MGDLRQLTSQIIMFGPFADSTDGVTPETGLTITQADMKISKGGAAFAQKNAAGNAIHDVDGYYSTTLNTVDTNTTGILKLEVTIAGSVLVWETFKVVSQSYYDAKYTDTFNNVSTNDLDAALSNIHLDHLFATNYDPSNKPGNAGAWMNEAVEADGTGLEIRYTTKMLENIAAIAGNLVSGTFTWQTNTAATNPGLANIKGNNSTQANITEIYMNGTGELGGSAAPYVLRLKAGDELLISKEGTLSENIFFIVSGPATDNTGWFTIPGAVESVGSPAIDNGTKTTVQAFYPALETDEITSSNWNALKSAFTTAGSFGDFLDVKVSSVSGGGGLTQQNVRDAMKLTPTAGAPSADSVDEHLDEILLDTGTTIPAQIQARTKPSADYASANNLQITDNTVNSILTSTTATLPNQIDNLNDITPEDVLAAGDIDGFTLEESQRLILSANTGVLEGADTTIVTIKAADGSKARLTATVDASGNRTTVVKDATP